MHKSFLEILDTIKNWFSRPRQIRIVVICLVFLVLFGILTKKLYGLQVVNGESYSTSFMEGIERTVKIPGARGNIYDAEGNLLAYNKLSYNVTITDTGAYSSDYNARNLMLYSLAQIIEKHGVTLTTSFYVDMDENGGYYFTTKSEASRRRFIANVYGVSTSKLDDEEEKYPTAVTAEELLNRKADDYAFNAMKDSDGSPVIPTPEILLDMVKILFTMRQTAFQKYEKTTIAKGIDEHCMAEILENQGNLKGVSVEESYVRKYNNAKYFAHIIGYTGAIQSDSQLQDLKKSNSDYEITDIVGATGIEKSMENELQGVKGEKDLYVDSHGQVLEVISETVPEAGNDIYLTIDQNLQIGIYHLLEQQLAAIIGNKIVNMKAVDVIQPEKSSEIVIPVDDVYYQLINNNVLDTSHFFEDDAGSAEQQVAEAFKRHKQRAISRISFELMSNNDIEMSGLPNEYVSYMVFIYDLLTNEKIVNTSLIDQHGETYLSWKNDTTSLRDYLYSGISEGWIDIKGLLGTENIVKYQDSDYIYAKISDYIIEKINDNEAFDKIIYKYMIINDELSGKTLLMALYEQGVLTWDEDAYYALKEGSSGYAYEFLIDRIFDIDITPAQLALDPCMGSVVVTDVNTGQVKALVTYPGYDNNMIADRDYFNECLSDLSLPLINSATQTNKAPGSTFKPLSAIAVLEEGDIDAYDDVFCTGVYEEVTPNIKCWIGKPGHGNLNVAQAIENSCNYCFADYAHRMSTYRDEETGEYVYSTQVGLEVIRKYASMFGLDRISGIEIDEKEPSISDIDPERSSFGQGTHSFNNVQLARYTTALANNGKLFNLTLLKKETDSHGDLKEEFEAEVIDNIQISSTSWDTVHTGLRSVVTTGAAKKAFEGWKTVQIAGKTGTAEEVKTRGNHSFFISYAPYNNPEIAVTVSIPFGYTSGNAATLARNVYDYCYGATDLTKVISQDARSIGIINVIDE